MLRADSARGSFCRCLLASSAFPVLSVGIERLLLRSWAAKYIYAGFRFSFPSLRHKKKSRLLLLTPPLSLPTPTRLLSRGRPSARRRGPPLPSPAHGDGRRFSKWRRPPSCFLPPALSFSLDVVTSRPGPATPDGRAARSVAQHRVWATAVAVAGHGGVRPCPTGARERSFPWRRNPSCLFGSAQARRAPRVGHCGGRRRPWRGATLPHRWPRTRLPPREEALAASLAPAKLAGCIYRYFTLFSSFFDSCSGIRRTAPATRHPLAPAFCGRLADWPAPAVGISFGFFIFG